MYQVSDLARAARFYRETLGLPQEVYSEEWQWAEFNCGNITLALLGGVNLHGKVSGGRVAFAAEDVYAAWGEMKKKGVRVLKEPHDFGVCCAMEILDPDGNSVLIHRRADGTCGQQAEPEEKAAATILAAERTALGRWGKGDPSGFLEICDPGVVYFDDTQKRRLDGLKALTVLYEAIRGQISLDRFELVNPKVQFCGEAAVLTYNFVGHADGKAHRWNCTEVYRQGPAGWRIIQTHWSRTCPANP